MTFFERLTSSSGLMRLVPACAIALTLAGPSTASTFQFGGYFGFDDAADAAFVRIANTKTMVDLRTTSFVAGGFAPVLTVFAMTGQDGGPGDLLATSAGNTGSCEGKPQDTVDPVSGYCFDAKLTILLDPGLYLAVITQDANIPAGTTWADGYSHPYQDLPGPVATPWYGVFNYSGNTNYTGASYLADPSASFLLYDGTQRTARWDMTVQADANLLAYTAPEPRSSTWMWLGLGLTALIVWTRNGGRRNNVPRGQDWGVRTAKNREIHPLSKYRGTF